MTRRILYDMLKTESRRIWFTTLDPDAQTARTLTLVAIILQAVFIAFGILVAFVFFAPLGRVPSFFFGILFFGIVTGAFLLGVLWTVLDYVLIYDRLRRGEVAQSESSALILGILQLVLGGLIPGLLLIIAWVKIRDSLRTARDRIHGDVRA